MLTVISPAKKLDEVAKPLPDGIAMTDARFGADAAKLAKLAAKLSVADLQALSGISEPLAKLNQARFKALTRPPVVGEVFAAAQCFAGDTYTGLDLRSMSATGVAHAVGHLRILSGLYGLLRPFDGIRAYRLEMGSKLANPRGADLYAFWGDRIAKALRDDALEAGAALILNCASVEYFGAVAPKVLKLPVVTPVFLDEKDGKARVVSFWAKQARGKMARFVCENAIRDAGDLRGFTLGGYAYQPAQSSPERPVFLRQEPVAEKAA